MPLPPYLQPFGQNASEKTAGPTGYSKSKCPACGTNLAFGYVGSISDVKFNTLICENQKCRLQGQAQTEAPKPPEPSKVVIFPVAGRFEGPAKKIEPDETTKSDKKPMWDRLSLGSSRPKPTKYFCPTCCKTRAFIVSKDWKTRCPQCKCQFDVAELEDG